MNMTHLHIITYTFHPVNTSVREERQDDINIIITKKEVMIFMSKYN